MASQKNTDVYLETVEETQDQSEQLDATGNTGMAGMGGKQLPKSLLAYGEERSCPESDLKRKTRTGGMHEHP